MDAGRVAADDAWMFFVSRTFITASTQIQRSTLIKPDLTIADGVTLPTVQHK